MGSQEKIISTSILLIIVLKLQSQYYNGSLKLICVMKTIQLQAII